MSRLEKLGDRIAASPRLYRITQVCLTVVALGTFAVCAALAHHCHVPLCPP